MIDASQKDGEVLKSARSRQEKEMAEIEDILRRAAHVAAVSEKTEKEIAMKKALRTAESGQSWTNTKPVLRVQEPLGTPAAHSNTKSTLIGIDGPSKMQTAAANALGAALRHIVSPFF